MHNARKDFIIPVQQENNKKSNKNTCLWNTQKVNAKDWSRKSKERYLKKKLWRTEMKENLKISSLGPYGPGNLFTSLLWNKAVF